MALEDRYRALPFPEAIAYLQQKISVDSDRAYDVIDAQHDAAFVIAGAKGALLSELREAVTRALVEGQRLDDFQKRFNEITEGWTHAGNKAWRSRIIYDANIKMSHAAGRYEQIFNPDNLRLKPYLQYLHGNSANPRMHHLALNQRVFKAEDLPFYPPNGYLCSCKVISLSDRDLSRFSLEVSNIARGDTVPVTYKGETFNAVIQPEKGFDYIPGQTNAERRDQMRQDLLSRMAPDIRSQADKNFADIDKAMERLRADAPKPRLSQRSPDQTYQNIARQLFAKELKALDAALNPKPRSPEDRLKGAIAKLNEARAIAARTKDRTDIVVARALEVQIERARQAEAAKIAAEPLPNPAVDGLKAMERLRAAILERSLVSAEEAERWASTVKFTREALNMWGTAAEQRQRLAEVYRFANGNINTLDFIDADPNGATAYAQFGRRSITLINYPDWVRPVVVFHEMGHHLEYSRPDIADESHAWMVSRSNGQPPRSLREITGDARYGEKSLGYEDAWLSPYVGTIPIANTRRFFGVTTTEATSVGLERFSTPKGMLDLYQKDPDHFLFMLGVLRKPPMVSDAAQVVDQPRVTSRRNQIIETLGREAVEAAERKFSELLEKSDIQMRISPQNLERVIESGRFRSSIELAEEGGGKGDGYNNTLSEAERRMFGDFYEDRQRRTERPIYGYWSNRGGTPYDTDPIGQLEMYGSIAVRLKPEAIARTSISVGDSAEGDGVLPSAAAQPSISSLLSGDPDGWRSELSLLERSQSMADFVRQRFGPGDAAWVEAQVHGRVTVRDIAEIMIGEGTEIPASIVEWARIMNIPINRYSRPVEQPEDDDYGFDL